MARRQLEIDRDKLRPSASSARTPASLWSEMGTLARHSILEAFPLLLIFVQDALILVVGGVLEFGYHWLPSTGLFQVVKGLSSAVFLVLYVVTVTFHVVEYLWTRLGLKTRGSLVGLAAAVLALITGGAWVLMPALGEVSGARTRERPLRVSILHPEGSDVGAPVISPDGTRVAYTARRPDGMPMLWVRDLASGEARALPGTEAASLPFWSPDSRDLGFRAGSLKRVPADGGPVQIVHERGGSSFFGGTWGADGTIVFSAGDLLPLMRVNVTGGAATPATTLQGNDWSHFWPSFLPDGRRFLFTARLWTRTAETGQQGIYLGSLDSPDIRHLLPDLSNAVYAPPGVLVFVRDGTLTAAPFDLATGRVTGSPAPVGGKVAVDDYHSFSGLSAATDGTLAVRPSPAVALFGGDSWDEVPDAQLRVVDRDGTSKPVGPAQRYSYFAAINPDGRRVAVSIVDPHTGTTDIFLVDIQSGNKTPLTTTRGFAYRPVWSPDGTRLAYGHQPFGGSGDVYIRDLRTGQVTGLLEGPAYEDPVAWSHNGAALLVYKEEERVKGENRGHGLSVWSFESGTLTPFIGLGFLAAFSPDDRYVAFTSLESGRPEVSVTTFPERHQTWPLTTEGGTVLSWRADGREILVATLSGKILAYPVSTESGFTAGQPTVLVRDLGGAARFSAATRDHSKIVVRVSPDAAKDKGEIRLLFGWADAWRRGKVTSGR